MYNVYLQAEHAVLLDVLATWIAEMGRSQAFKAAWATIRKCICYT